MAEMTSSASDLEREVMQLLQTRRYDPTILPRLEEYVNYQVTKNFCDSDVNLAVLKLYQFYPDRYNASTVSNILIKALMNFPGTDFLCSLYLIPERRQVDEPIPVISRLASLLETGRFTEFWAESGACADLLASVPGALNSFRNFMCEVVSRTYKTIDLKKLGEVLDLSGDETRKYVINSGWTVEGDVVICPGNEENQPRPPSLDEHLSFKQVASKMI